MRGLCEFLNRGKMTELVMLVDQKKSDVVGALKLKTQLWDNGIVLSGLVLKSRSNGIVPSVFLEEMMQLKVIGSLQEN